MYCPVCGESYGPGELSCLDDGAALIEEAAEVAFEAAQAAGAFDPTVRTSYLGTFPGFQCELVMTILKEHGIYAYPKNPAGEGEHSQYGPMLSVDGVILVDAAREDEARRVIETELPQHMQSIQQAMDTLDVDGDA